MTLALEYLCRICLVAYKFAPSGLVVWPRRRSGNRGPLLPFRFICVFVRQPRPTLRSLFSSRMLPISTSRPTDTPHHRRPPTRSEIPHRQRTRDLDSRSVPQASLPLVLTLFGNAVLIFFNLPISNSQADHTLLHSSPRSPDRCSWTTGFGSPCVLRYKISNSTLRYRSPLSSPTVLLSSVLPSSQAHGLGKDLACYRTFETYCTAHRCDSAVITIGVCTTLAATSHICKGGCSLIPEYTSLQH